MCKCGCNTCETKGPLLTEGKVKSLLSEGLQYHIDKKIPLFETVYRIGSDKHLALIKEARKMYSRNVIDLCEDDEALIKTHLGEFALYEGVSVPLDLPMLNESDSNYPDFDLNKNIRYQDTSISSGMWRYTGQEQGGKGVYRNLNNGQILAFDKSDFDIFKNNLSSHFDISESLNENKAIITFKNDYEVKMNTGEGYDDDFEYFEAGEREQVYILDKNDKRTHVEFGDGTNAYIPTSLISIQEKSSLNESDKQELILTQIRDILKSMLKGDEDREEGIEDLDLSMDTVAGALTGKSPFSLDIDQDVYGRLASIEEVTRYSGFNRNPEDSDSEKFEPTGSVSEFKEDLRALFGKFKGDLKNPEFIKGVAQIMVNWKSLLRSQLDEAKKKKEKKDPPLNKPKRGGSKAYYVYVRDPKTKKIKKVSFGSGGLRAKIRNSKARKAFAARHNCKNKKDRTKAGYWSCNLPRYAPALGLGAKMNTFW